MTTDNSQWRFLRKALYNLKRDYNVQATVCQVLDTVTQYTTGKRTISRNLYHIRRAIMLPAEEQRKVEQGIAHLSTNKWFTSQAGFDLEEALFIFDAKDLPDGFRFNIDDFIIVDGEYHKVTEVDEYEYDAGWVIKTHLDKGAVFTATLDVFAESTLMLSQSANRTF